jgi:hypothetical protein
VPLLERGRRHFQAFPVAGAAVAPPVTPADVSGITAWYDGADPATLFQDAARTIPAAADGDPVGGWATKIGSRHLSQATPAARPSRRDGVVNGHSVIRSDGVDDGLTGPVMSTLMTDTAWTTLCVFRPVVVDTDDGTYASANDAAWSDGSGYLGVHLRGSGSIWVHAYDIANSAYRSVIYPGGWSAGVPVLIMSRQEGGRLYAARNGGVESSDLLAQSYLVGPLNALRGVGHYCGEDICELIFASVPLVPGDLAGLTTYLKSKWGIP